MAVPPRLLFFTALAAAPALLLMTGCGEDATGARTTLAEVQSTSYVVQEPITVPPTTVPVTNPTGSGPAVDPNEQTYTVQSGDSVYAIANDFGIEPEVLANFNGWPEGVTHGLFAGDIIKIPPGSQVPGSGDTGTTDGTDTSATESDTEPDTADTTAAPGAIGCEHTVVAGDNPSRLAEQYNVTLDELNAVNAGNAAYGHFQLGSQIHIPANGEC